jgi:hypothetical protein
VPNDAKGKAHGVISSAFGFSGSAAFAFVAGAGIVDFSSFLSGNPNLAARFANTSSLIPKGALSIAPTFSFFSTGAAAAAGVVVVGGLGLDAVGVGFGLNAIPNRSARDFIAFCSAVRVGSVVDGASGAGAGSDVVYHQLAFVEGKAGFTGAASGSAAVGPSGATYHQLSHSLICSSSTHEFLFSLYGYASFK